MPDLIGGSRVTPQTKKARTAVATNRIPASIHRYQDVYTPFCKGFSRLVHQECLGNLPVEVFDKSAPFFEVLHVKQQSGKGAEYI